MSDLPTATMECINDNFDEALKKIRHCVGQLSDEQIWWRPDDSMNSIGNLLLHLRGNVTQWIMSGVAGEPDNRDRPAEFNARESKSKDELLRNLEETVETAKSTLLDLPGDTLLEARRIQAFETHVLGAAVHVVTHFHGHMQEIISMTRMQLGADYQFEWAPRTPEQGA